MLIGVGVVVALVIAFWAQTNAPGSSPQDGVVVGGEDEPRALRRWDSAVEPDGDAESAVAWARFELPVGCDYRVIVLDDEGVALDRADVTFVALRRSGRTVVARRKSDREGRVEWPGLPALDASFVSASATTASGAVSTEVPVFPGTQAVLRCRGGASLDLGLVREGKLVGGTVVVERIDPDNGTRSDGRDTFVGGGTRTAVPVAGAGRYRVTAIAGQSVSPVVEVDVLAEGGATEVTLQLPTEPRAIVVRAGETSQPVTGIDTFLNGQKISLEPTDQSGAGRIFAIPESRFSELSLGYHGTPVVRPASAHASADGRLELILPKGPVPTPMTVTVVSTDNLPLPGASVGWSGATGAVALGQSTTDEYGVARGVPTTAKILVAAPGHLPKIVAIGERVPVTVTLEPVAPVAVRVVNAAGDPVAFANVTITPMEFQGGPILLTFVAAEDGRCSIPAQDGWQAMASDNGNGASSPFSPVVAGDTVLTLRLREPEAFVARVTCELPPGADQSGPFSVTVRGRHGRRFESPTTEFDVKGSRQYLELSVFDVRTGYFGSYAGPFQPDIRVPMKALQPVRVRVLNPEGALIEGDVAVLGRERGEQNMTEVEATLSEDGEIVALLPRKGTWDLEISVGRRSGDVLRLQVGDHAGDSGQASVTLYERGGLSLHFARPVESSKCMVELFREPPEGIPVRAGDLMRVKRAAEIGSGRVCTIRGVPSGTYRVFVRGRSAAGRNWIGGNAAVVVRPGEEAVATAWTVDEEECALDIPRDVEAGELLSLALSPAGESAWLGGLIRGSISRKGDDYVLPLWFGTFDLVDEEQVPQFELQVYRAGEALRARVVRVLK